MTSPRAKIVNDDLHDALLQLSLDIDAANDDGDDDEADYLEAELDDLLDYLDAIEGAAS